MLLNSKFYKIVIPSVTNKPFERGTYYKSTKNIHIDPLVLNYSSLLCHCSVDALVCL